MASKNYRRYELPGRLKREWIAEKTDRLIDDIRRHAMADTDYTVEITEKDGSPDTWPIQRIEMTVTAEDEERAEEIAEALIKTLEKERHVTGAMEVNEVYEV